METEGIPLDNTGKHNRYECASCKHTLVTIDRDAGVTPFTIGCDKCEKPMKTGLYHESFKSLIPTYEWYKPGEKELSRIGEEMREWVLGGHLLMRVIGGDLHGDFVEDLDD